MLEENPFFKRKNTCFVAALACDARGPAWTVLSVLRGPAALWRCGGRASCPAGSRVVAGGRLAMAGEVMPLLLRACVCDAPGLWWTVFALFFVGVLVWRLGAFALFFVGVFVWRLGVWAMRAFQCCLPATCFSMSKHSSSSPPLPENKLMRFSNIMSITT